MSNIIYLSDIGNIIGWFPYRRRHSLVDINQPRLLNKVNQWCYQTLGYYPRLKHFGIKYPNQRKWQLCFETAEDAMLFRITYGIN